jgi:hypothetical protein
MERSSAASRVIADTRFKQAAALVEGAFGDVGPQSAKSSRLALEVKPISVTVL